MTLAPAFSSVSRAVSFDDALLLVMTRLESAGMTERSEKREALALAIFADVARFVLAWQEGPAYLLAAIRTDRSELSGGRQP